MVLTHFLAGRDKNVSIPLTDPGGEIAEFLPKFNRLLNIMASRSRIRASLSCAALLWFAGAGTVLGADSSPSVQRLTVTALKLHFSTGDADTNTPSLKLRGADARQQLLAT